MQSLLLNADWQPLRIISWRRAICLVLEDEADVLEEHDTLLIRSPSVTFKLPLVIRLKAMVKVPFRAKIPLNRRAVLARDGGVCAYCGKTASTIDHVQPRSRGGLHRWENVVACCRPCNAAKDDRLLSELGDKWVLDFKPYAPTGTQWLILGLASRLDESWGPYLGLEVSPTLASV